MSLPYVVDGETELNSELFNPWVDHMNGLQTGALPIPLSGIEGALGEYAEPESESPLGNIRNGVVNVRDYGTTAAKINEAAAAAKAAGALLVGRGTFLIDETVEIACDADFSAATCICDDNTLTALRIGTTTPGIKIGPIRVQAPKVIQTKTGTGWSGSDVGIEIANLFWSEVSIPHISNFKQGLRVTAYGTGTCYNTIRVGYLRNNQVQQVWQPSAPGSWTTENTIIGGWYFYALTEGLNIPDTRYILIDDTGDHVNGLVFIQPSLEGDAPEIHIEIREGGQNLFLKPRCEVEDTDEGWKVLLTGTMCQYNEFMSPTNLEAIKITETDGARRNSLYAPDQWWMDNGDSLKPSVVLQNSTSGGMLLAAVAYNDAIRSDAQANYKWGLFEEYTRFKAPADTHPRLEVEHATGRLYWGGGSGAADGTFGRLGAGVIGTTSHRIAAASFRVGGGDDDPRLYSGSWDPEGVTSGTPGSLFLRTTGQVYKKSTGTGNTGWSELT